VKPLPLIQEYFSSAASGVSFPYTPIKSETTLPSCNDQALNNPLQGRELSARSQVELDSLADNAWNVPETFYHDLMYLMPASVVYFAEAGPMIKANSFLLGILEIPEDDSDFGEIKLRELFGLKTAGGATILDTLVKGESIWVNDVEFTTLNKRKVWLNISGKPRRDRCGDVVGAVIICSDVTEFKQLQQRFLQSQKMEIMGLIASGVIHDFNNLLMVIGGNCELMRYHLRSGNPLETNIDEIQNATERATNLTRQLLAFCRNQALSESNIDVSKIVADSKKMLHRVLGELIELTLETDPYLWQVHANPGHIEQLFLNLLLNSRDAMPNGGRITVKMLNLCIRNNTPAVPKRIPPGNYIHISVSDTGIGIPPAVLGKIFDPFFTTKESGKGTGLGLATVNDIIRVYKGFVQATSEENVGTTFDIYLPAISEKAQSALPESEDEAFATGNEAVMVVDDDDSIRELLSSTLTESGYKVYLACDGDEAMEISKELGAPVQLLITDLGMPKISGLELADNLKERWADLKVMVISGHNTNEILKQGLLRREFAYLQKPFKLATLHGMIRELMC